MPTIDSHSLSRPRDGKVPIRYNLWESMAKRGMVQRHTRQRSDVHISSMDAELQFGSRSLEHHFKSYFWTCFLEILLKMIPYLHISLNRRHKTQFSTSLMTQSHHHKDQWSHQAVCRFGCFPSCSHVVTEATSSTTWYLPFALRWCENPSL